jgi:hypothetical protein
MPRTIRLIPTELLSLLKGVLHEVSQAGALYENNAEASQSWIEALSAAFESYFGGNKHVAVFRRSTPSGYFRRGKAERSECLFDILVCEMGETKPPIHTSKEPLNFVRRSVMQVESEFAENTAASIEDMSKLVCGSAPISLFVGPLTSRGPNPYLKVARAVAPSVQGKFYCAFVLPPSDWGKDREEPLRLYLWKGGDWTEVTGPKSV